MNDASKKNGFLTHISWRLLFNVFPFHQCLSLLHQPRVIVLCCLVEALLDASGLLNLLVIPNATPETTLPPQSLSPLLSLLHPRPLPSSPPSHSPPRSEQRWALHRGERNTLQTLGKTFIFRQRFYFCPPDVFLLLLILLSLLIMKLPVGRCPAFSFFMIFKEKIHVCPFYYC